MESFAFGLMTVSTIGLIATLKYVQSKPELYEPFGHKNTPNIKDGENPAAMRPEMAAHNDAAQKKIDATSGTRKVDKAP
jgi:hypothetical protein